MCHPSPFPPSTQALQGDASFVETTVKSLLQRCLHGASYAERRGAAFGLAGAVRGLGISSLRALGVMDALKAGVEDKGAVDAREGEPEGRGRRAGTMPPCVPA